MSFSGKNLISRSHSHPFLPFARLSIGSSQCEVSLLQKMQQWTPCAAGSDQTGRGWRRAAELQAEISVVVLRSAKRCAINMGMPIRFPRVIAASHPATAMKGTPGQQCLPGRLSKRVWKGSCKKKPQTLHPAGGSLVKIPCSSRRQRQVHKPRN